jgi:hypothetical protein
MEGFGLFVGHLVGDLIFQNDYMAKYKSSPYPGPKPTCADGYNPGPNTYQALEDWNDAWSAFITGNVACSVHCLVYTLMVFLCSFWWLPPWAYTIVFATHWPIDRFRLARKLMTIMGQDGFATGPLSPWSIIVIDQSLHLLILFLLGIIVQQPWNH